MKKNLFVVISILLLLAFYFACRKIDRISEKKPLTKGEIEAKFFDSHKSSDTLIQAAIKFVKSQNDKYHFVENITKKVGYPFWDKSIVIDKGHVSSANRGNGGGGGPTTSTVIVPFVEDTGKVVHTGLVLLMRSTDTTFHWMADWQYADTATTKMTPDDFSITMMWLQRAVFQDTLFRLDDSGILPTSTLYAPQFVGLQTISDGTTTGIGGRSQTMSYYSFTICYSYYTSNDGQLHGCYPGQENCNYYTYHTDCDYISWFDEDEDGGSGDPGGGPGSGGGGSGGGSGLDPPSCGREQNRGQTVNCNPGWHPVSGGSDLLYENKGYHHFETISVSVPDYEKIETWRLHNVDTTGLDTCVQKILNKILSSTSPMGRLLAKMERSIFKTPNIEKFQVVFRASTSLPYTTQGETEQGHYNPTTGVFLDTILLNQNMIDSATEVYVAAIIVHEMVHCYLKSIFHRWFYSDFNSTFITRMPIDTLFNKYVDSMLVINSRNGLNAWWHDDPEKDHSYMADHMLGAFADVLKFVDDGRNTDEFYWLLSWSGLKDSRTYSYYYPNRHSPSPFNWPPSNPAPNNDSTWGLKYAFTTARIGSLINFLSNERFDTAYAQGRRRVSGDCYH